MSIEFDKLRGRPFLEKTGIIPTVATPTPRYSPDDSSAQSLPLRPPLPQPDLLIRTASSPEALPGDGEVQDWPYPE